MELLGQTNLEEPDYSCYCLVNAIRKWVFQWDMFGEEAFFLEQKPWFQVLTEESEAINRHHLSSLEITEKHLGALLTGSVWQAQSETSKEGSPSPQKTNEKCGLLDIHQPTRASHGRVLPNWICHWANTNARQCTGCPVMEAASSSEDRRGLRKASCTRLHWNSVVEDGKCHQRKTGGTF